MSARPEITGNRRGAGSFYARVFDIAWRHAERMTDLMEAAGTARNDCHDEGLDPERTGLMRRKVVGRPVPAE